MEGASFSAVNCALDQMARKIGRLSQKQRTLVLFQW